MQKLIHNDSKLSARLQVFSEPKMCNVTLSSSMYLYFILPFCAISSYIIHSNCLFWLYS